MSKNFLPPVPAEPPAKVVFEGVEPGSPEAQRLYHENAGPISRFHQRARQSRLISEQPGSQMHQALPNGGRMTYSFNHGLEIVRVRLEPIPPTPVAQEAPPEPLRLPTFDPVLAIDVLFEPELFLAGDVYSKTVETITPPPPTETPWWDQSAWVKRYESGIGAAFFNLYAPGYTGVGLYWVLGDYQSFDSPGQMLGAVASGDVVFFNGDDHDQTPLSAFVTYGAIDHNGVDLITETGWFLPSLSGGGGGGGGEPYDETTHVRDQRWYFDVLNVVGMRVQDDPDDPHDAPYSAISTAPVSDARLKPLDASVPVTTRIDRDLPADETAPLGFTGYGFVARPHKPIDPNIPGDPPPVVIDVYASSTNLTKANTWPGPEGATFEADDPSFTYDLKDELTLRIRVREFVRAAPVVVEVTTTTEMKDIHFTAPGLDQEPTDQGPDILTESTRTVVWRFAVARGWADPGGEPTSVFTALPDGSSAMGVLLASTLPITKEVVGPDPLGRTILTEPAWSGPVEEMTKVATITWNPPKDDRSQGTATIEVA